jgi:hypothetical protein
MPNLISRTPILSFLTPILEFKAKKSGEVLTPSGFGTLTGLNVKRFYLA